MVAEEQLEHDILMLVWNKKENEAIIHIFLQVIFTCDIKDRKDHIHTAAQI